MRPSGAGVAKFFSALLTPRLSPSPSHSVQLNAYPPTPKANVDLYTSYIYGDAGVTVTMVIKTCVTRSSSEAPNLHIELFMAPPQAM